jgi:hypothetical protein
VLSRAEFNAAQAAPTPSWPRDIAQRGDALALLRSLPDCCTPLVLLLPCVDVISWDNGRPGNGYRSRRRGGYLLVLQKRPLKAKATWSDHGIPDRWVEKAPSRRGQSTC